MTLWKQTVLVEGTSSLEVESQRIGLVDETVHGWVRQLNAVLESYREETGFGRGIAAPQIGINRRLVVLNLGGGPIALINPEITWRSEEMQWVWDDCLSVPDKIVRVQRHQSISLTYTDLKQRVRHWEHLPADMAELVQHEIDHLDGILMTAKVAEDAEAIRTIEERPRLIGSGRQVSRLSVAHVIEALDLIDPVFLNSPQYFHHSLSDVLGCRLMVKVETVNPIRSFKGRGADYFFTKVAQTIGEKPLVTASVGNWGQALAYACRKHGLPISIFVSKNANHRKVAAMRALGAKICVQGDDFDEAKAAGKAHAQHVGGWFLEDGLEPAVTEGHGTIGWELLARGDLLHDIVVPLGNGALLNGIGLWVKACDPAVKTIGVCATGAPSMRQAWMGRAWAAPDETGRRTIADGIDVREPIPEAVTDMAGRVDDVLLVEDDHLREAMNLAMEHMGLELEPAGAASLAAVIAHKDRFADRRVAVILTGSHPMC